MSNTANRSSMNEADKNQDLRDVEMEILNSLSQPGSSLPPSKSKSERISSSILKWMDKFNNITLNDNVTEAFRHILEQMVSEGERLLLHQDDSTSYFCRTCDREFVSEDEHHDEMLKEYFVEILTNSDKSESVFEFIHSRLLDLGRPTTVISKSEHDLTSSVVNVRLESALKLLRNGRKPEATVIYFEILAGLKETSDEDFVMSVLSEMISQLYENEPDYIYKGFKSLLRTFPKTFPNDCNNHVFFVNHFMKLGSLKDYKLALAAYHYVLTENGDFSACFKKATVELLSNHLETAFDRGDFKILSELLILMNRDNLIVLENFVEKNLKLFDLECTSGEIKAFFLLIKGSIAKVKQNYVDALIMFQNALRACSESPFNSRDGICSAVVKAIDLNFHRRIAAYLYSEVDEMKQNLQASFLPAINPDFHHSTICSLKCRNQQFPSNMFLDENKNEDVINQTLKTPFEKALAYFNLSTTIGFRGSLMAIIHLLESIAATDDLSLSFAYSKIVEQTAIECYKHVQRNEYGPNVQMYVCRLIFSAFVKSSLMLREKLLKYNSPLITEKKKEDILSPKGNILTSTVARRIIRLFKVYPLILMPIQSISDQILQHDFEITFLTRFIHERSTSSHHSSYFPKHYYSSEELDSVWRGWGKPNSKVTFESCRLNSMIDTLQLKQWTINDVEEIMMWPLIRRTEHGWLNNEKTDLNFDSYPNDQVFNSCRGVEIHLITGKVTLLLDKGEPASLKLLSLADIQEVLSSYITSAHLTLDNPDSSIPLHPFQEFSYWPSSLQNTNYLHTILHAGYLLNEIATGIEVNGCPPFEMQAFLPGFLQRLPLQLQLKLQPILDLLHNPVDSMCENGHKLWIELNNIEVTSKVSNNTICYEFGTVHSEVKARKWRQPPSDFSEDDDPTTLTSAQRLLAKALTIYYNEIGFYFPILLRLKELAKLSAIVQLLSLKAHAWSERLKIIEGYSRLAAERDEILDDYEKTVTMTLEGYRNQRWDPPHPIYTWERVEEKYQSTLRLNSLQGKEHLLKVGERDRVRRAITNDLKKTDERRFSNCAEQIAKLYEIEVARVQPLIRGWFDKKQWATTKLAEICFEGKRTKEAARFHELLKELNAIGIPPQSYNEQSNDGKCRWVPVPFYAMVGPFVESSEESDKEVFQTNESFTLFPDENYESQGVDSVTETNCSSSCTSEQLNDDCTNAIAEKQTTTLPNYSNTAQKDIEKSLKAKSSIHGSSNIQVGIVEESALEEHHDVMNKQTPKQKYNQQYNQKPQLEKFNSGQIYGCVFIKPKLEFGSFSLSPPIKLVAIDARTLKSLESDNACGSDSEAVHVHRHSSTAFKSNNIVKGSRAARRDKQISIGREFLNFFLLQPSKRSREAATRREREE